MRVWWISVASCLIAAVFTFVMFGQYRRRRRMHQLFWTLGLAMFTVATFGEFYGAALGWTPTTYKLYYFAGVALPGLLGVGTVYLMARGRLIWAHLYAAAVVVVTVLFLLAVGRAQLDVAVLASSGIAPTHADIMPLSARRPFSVLLSAVGGTVLVGGALYSWLRHGLAYNRLIGAGGILFVISGSLASRLGIVEFIPVTNLVGVILIFAGVMAAARTPRPSLPRSG